MKFGLVGCGAISKCYAQAIERIDGSQLVCACDSDPRRAREFCDGRDMHAYDSYEEMLRSPIDTVCICTPSGLHATLAIEAMNAGKHVVCEKPIGITTEQLDRLEAVSREKKLAFCAISQIYFSDAYQQAKTAVDEGRLGKLILGDISMKFFRSEDYYRQGGWRGTVAMDGGGALMNQGIHGVAMLRHIMGPVKSVTALSRTLLHDIETEDTAVAILEFQNGALGNLVGATSVQPACPRVLSVHGAKGSIVLTEATITRWDIPGEAATIATGGHSGVAANPMDFPVALHQRQIEDLIDAVTQNRPSKLGATEGRWPVDMILAVYESSRTGKTVYFS